MSYIPPKTDLPYNAEALPKEELVRLLKRVADERDAAFTQLQSVGTTTTTTATKGSAKKRQKTISPDVPTYNAGPNVPYGIPPPVQQNYLHPIPTAAAVVPVTDTNFDVAGTKKRILKNATAKIKKTVHTDRNKPYTEVLECVPNEPAVLSLMDGFEPKSHRHAMIKWQLTENDVIDWLEMHEAPLLHPVTSKINTICLFGEKPNLYVHAKIESLEIKWERKSGAFNMRFRSQVAGYGRPPHFSPAK